MPDKQTIERASVYMDELTTRLNTIIKAGKGFGNADVIWLIKMWTKVGILTQDSAYHRRASAYFQMNREPTPSTGKRSLTLYNALGAFESIMNNNGTVTGDYFNRADKAMLDFVWEYRRRLPGTTDPRTSESEFTTFLAKWAAMKASEVMKQEVANFDRSL